MTLSLVPIKPCCMDWYPSFKNPFFAVFSLVSMKWLVELVQVFYWKQFSVPCNVRYVGEFANRNCMQRWCNKKGNTTCQICNQGIIFFLELPKFKIGHYESSFTLFRNFHQMIFFHQVRGNAIMAIDIR